MLSLPSSLFGCIIEVKMFDCILIMLSELQESEGLSLLRRFGSFQKSGAPDIGIAGPLL